VTLSVHSVTSGVYRQNGYILVSESGSALLIDPGSESDRYKSIIEDLRIEPQAILATHAHFDHVGAVAELIDQYSIPFFLHEGDRRLLTQMNLYKMVVEKGPALKVPDSVENIMSCKSPSTFGEFEVQVLETPGHTPGGVCLIVEDHIFTGDTLLPAGAGRTDLPGGNDEQLRDSLLKLDELSGELMAYPGHGSSMKLFELRHSAGLKDMISE